eukprot:gene11364-11513_t
MGLLQQQVDLLQPSDDSLQPYRTNISKVLAYPHVNECHLCSVCIPQFLVDRELPELSSPSRANGSLFTEGHDLGAGQHSEDVRQNLYLTPEGGVSLIDNDQCYGSGWRPCGADSLFLPGTQKFEVARLGYSGASISCEKAADADMMHPQLHQRLDSSSIAESAR